MVTFKINPEVLQQGWRTEMTFQLVEGKTFVCYRVGEESERMTPEKMKLMLNAEMRYAKEKLENAERALEYLNNLPIF